MLSDYWNHVPRKPRHPAAETEKLRTEMERSSEKVPRVVEAELLDVSRNGFQARTSFPLAVGEQITLRLHVDRQDFHLSVPADVRWRRSEGGRSWLLGCMSNREIDWESLGELFLHGVLATDGS